ncbi:MAG: hypothetical protein QXF12_03070 [Candidatus Aenigmatarchaeota archaeon]
MQQRIIQQNLPTRRLENNALEISRATFGNTEYSPNLNITNLQFDWLENPLSMVDNPSYFIKLFMISDEDSIRVFNSNNPIDYLRKVRSIIIAETGSTALNIEDLSFTTAVTVGYNNRLSMMTNGSMKIFEPMGMSLYDRLVLASQSLGIRNFYKSPFYLEIKFQGYDEFGNFIDQIGTTLEEKRSWFYRIIITDIKTKIGPEGSTHELSFVSSDDIGTYDKFFKIGAPISPQGKTVRDIIDQIIKAKEQEEIDSYGYIRNIYKFNFIPLNPIMGSVNVSNLIKKLNPLDWSLQKNTLFDPNTSISNNDINKKEVNFSRGESIANILEQIFVNTEEGQALTRRSSIPKQYGDESEFIITWFITPQVKIRSDQPYDWIYNDYNYEIEYVILPHLSVRGLGTIKQQIPIIEQDVKKLEEKIKVRIETKRLRKKYEYLFTGLNTEIIRFELYFDMLWRAIIPSYGGANVLGLNTPGKLLSKEDFYGLEQKIINNYNKINQQEREISRLRNEINAKNLLSKTTPEEEKNISKLSEKLIDLQINTAILREETERSRIKFQDAVEREREEKKKNLNFGKIAYLEDLDIFNNRITLPVTIDKSNKNSNFFGRGNIEGEKPIEQAMATAILNQLQSGNLIEIDLTIKGDPYWLGTTHLEKERYTNINSQLSPDLPVYTTGEYYMLLKFKIPMGVDELTGEPIIRNNDQFSGIYIVLQVNHNFNDGIFTQSFKAVRDVNSDITPLNI